MAKSPPPTPSEQTRRTLFAGPERTPLVVRGLHIDLCRHFIEVETVLRIVGVMADLRLNTLHLHLSDDQALPVEFAAFPSVHTSPYWSIADQERIAAACREHGIAVIPEIDIPGHARALLSFFDASVAIERRLGVVTRETIDIERDLPVVLGMYEELAERWDARRIHMGGDEATGYPRFAELVTRVCDWARPRGLDVVAWDGILDGIDTAAVPDNLIVQVWREDARRTLDSGATLLSNGYFLDHVADPFTMYERSPRTGGAQLGCIACMWTELVTDRTIEATIFPSLYMMAHRWWTFPEVDPDPPALLRRLCDAFGHPRAEPDGWRSRLWVDFDDPGHPRATCSVTLDDALTRPHDLYPVFAPAMVEIADALYRWERHGVSLTEETVARIREQFTDCFGASPLVLDTPAGFVACLGQALGTYTRSPLHTNAWDAVHAQLRR